MKDLHVDSYLYDTIYIRFLGRIFWLHSTPCSRPRGGDTHLLEEWQGVIRSLPSIWYIFTRTTLGYFLCQFWYQINRRESVLSWYFSSINKFIEELDIQDSVKQLFGRQITEGLPLMLAKKVLSIFLNNLMPSCWICALLWTKTPSSDTKYIPVLTLLKSI